MVGASDLGKFFPMMTEDNDILLNLTTDTRPTVQNVEEEATLGLIAKVVLLCW